MMWGRGKQLKAHRPAPLSVKGGGRLRNTWRVFSSVGFVVRTADLPGGSLPAGTCCDFWAPPPFRIDLKTCESSSTRTQLDGAIHSPLRPWSTRPPFPGHILVVLSLFPLPSVMRIRGAGSPVITSPISPRHAPTPSSIPPPLVVRATHICWSRPAGKGGIPNLAIPSG